MVFSKPVRNPQKIANLTLKTDVELKLGFIRILNFGISIMLILVLILMSMIAILNSPPSKLSFIMVGSALSLNIIIFYINKRGHVLSASYLFCLSLNTIPLYFYFANILAGNIAYGYLFGCTLTLSGLLGSILISAKSSFGFASLNTIILTVSRIFFDLGAEIMLMNLIPLIGFLFMMATISWLYQNHLDQANNHLRNAQLLEQEMEIAHDLQQRFFPPPPLLENGISIASHLEPARETSGDFYDFIDLGDDKLGIVVADVTGKSLAAALIMTMTRSVVRSEARRNTSSAEVFYQVNETLLQDTSSDKMVTAFYGILDKQDLIFEMTNAGHPPAILKRGNKMQALKAHGLPLNSLSGTNYKSTSLQLQPGDQIVLYTDGVYEAMDSNQMIFGFERLNAIILETKSTSPDELLDAILGAVKVFQGETEYEDDITLVVINIDLDDKVTTLSETLHPSI